MATLAFDEPAAPATRTSTRAVVAGRFVSGLLVAMLTLDGAMKLIAPEAMIANSPPGILPHDAVSYGTVGVILLVSTLLYAIPRTAVLGAILVTGYLGGAVASNLVVHNPVLSHTLFGVFLGIAVWGSLWLRDPRLRALLPLR